MMPLLPRPAGRRIRSPLGLVLAFAFAFTAIGRAGNTNEVPSLLHVFFSKRVLVGINDNDARATVKTWTQIVVREAGSSAETFPEVGYVNDVIEGFREGRIHAASIPTDDYFKLNQATPADHLFTPINNGTPFEEYVLLVRAESSVTNITQLKGSKVMIFAHHRMTLAELWLDTVLAKLEQPAVDSFFGTLRREIKASSVVLPVFFRNADACLVTRRNFELMAELNPQVGKQCHVLLASPKVVPNIFCFNARVHLAIGDHVRKSMRDLHKSKLGQQVLTTFQMDQFADGDANVLDSTLELIREHERFCAKNGNAATVATSSSLITKPPE